MKRELDIPLEENAGKDEMKSWKMRMEAGQDKRRMLWRNQELWLLGGGVLALLVCILVPHIWISALVLAGWLGISAILYGRSTVAIRRSRSGRSVSRNGCRSV